MAYTRTAAEQEQIIREWFGRHKHDYCKHDPAAPPLVWSEYFQWLLDALGNATAAQRTRPGDQG